MEHVELEDALRQRPGRRRVVMGLLTGAVVLLTVCGLVLATMPQLPASVGELLHGTPTPTATIAPGGDMVYYEHGAPWGHLTVDGHPVVLTVTPNLALLTRGRHTLSYQADPFPALRCTISTPAAPSDTCPLDAAFADARGVPLGNRRAVDLGSTPDRLPQAQRDTLVAAIRRAVEYTSPTATVHPGEYYAGVNGASITRETAPQPMSASIQIRLQLAATADSNPDFPTLNCAAVCSAPVWWPANDTASPADRLEVLAHVKIGYHYTAPAGAVVLDYGPLLQTQQTAWSPDTDVTLTVGWDGGWQVGQSTAETAADGTSPCIAGQGDLYGGASVGEPLYTVTATRPAPNPTDGCLLIVQRGTDAGGPPPSGPPLLFLERFGVLMAVGADGLQVNPYLPLAGPEATAVAEAITAHRPLP